MLYEYSPRFHFIAIQQIGIAIVEYGGFQPAISGKANADW